ncbi:glycosyltransferase [Aerococcaceae bacterium NML190938]|nr:glycosyltransferase [Aerococcaceae bacterium NML190938]
MYKVLVFGMSTVRGGVWRCLENYTKYIDNRRIQFDFLCNSYEEIPEEATFLARGIKIYKTPRRFPNYLRYKREVQNFFKQHAHEYDAIWVNISNLVNIDYLILSKKYGIPRIILHSHGSRSVTGKIKDMFHLLNKQRIDYYATDFWACSVDAAKWLFTEKGLSKAVIVNNAIDIESVCYNEVKRERYRNMLGMNDCQTLIGNIARLEYPKNQVFLIEIMHAFLHKYPQVELVLVGDGSDKDEIVRTAESLGIQDRIHIVGEQEDVQGWLSAIDVFVLPSLFEGLPLAALEAQANGLPLLYANDDIPESVNVVDGGYVIGESLLSSLGQWCEQLEKLVKLPTRLSSEVIRSKFAIKGYDITVESQRLEKLFLQESREHDATN